MPHFENIDQYETSKTRNGRKQIMPIAPHSLQATEYRPRKQDRPKPEDEIKTSPFDEVEFEPVSVRQMEKEFRQAGRTIIRPRRKKPKLSKRIASFFKGLLSIFKKGKKQKPRHHKFSSRRRQPDRKAQAGDRSSSTHKSSTKGKRRNRGRSGRNPQGQDEKSRDAPQHRDGSRKDGARKEGNRKNQRSRRGRRHPQQQQKQGNHRDSPKKES